MRVAMWEEEAVGTVVCVDLHSASKEGWTEEGTEVWAERMEALVDLLRIQL